MTMAKMTGETHGGKYSGNVSGGLSMKGSMAGANVKGSRLNEGGDMKPKGARKGAGKKIY